MNSLNEFQEAAKIDMKRNQQVVRQSISLTEFFQIQSTHQTKLCCVYTSGSLSFRERVMIISRKVENVQALVHNSLRGKLTHFKQSSSKQSGTSNCFNSFCYCRSIPVLSF